MSGLAPEAPAVDARSEALRPPRRVGWRRLVGVTAQGAGESDEEREHDPDADGGDDLGGVS